jgi:signal transduction histidine kinase
MNSNNAPQSQNVFALWQSWRGVLAIAGTCTGLVMLLHDQKTVTMGLATFLTAFTQAALFRYFRYLPPRFNGLKKSALTVLVIQFALMLLFGLLNQVIPKFGFAGVRNWSQPVGSAIAMSIPLYALLLLIQDIRNQVSSDLGERIKQSMQTLQDATEQSWLRQFFSSRFWQQPVTVSSEVLDPWTVPRVLSHLVRNWFTAMIFAIIVVAALHSAKMEQDPVAQWATTTIETDLFTFFLLPLAISLGHVFLLIANRNWPRINRSLTAINTLHIAGSVTATLIAAFTLRYLEHPLSAQLTQLTAWISVLFTIAALTGIQTRYEFIQTARRIDSDSKTQVAQAERAAALTDLQALQAQIEPHFLYNTLTNLQLLIRQDAKPEATQADAMAGHLIDYLRARLPIMREQLVPLAKEVEMVESYLELIKIRMGERLSTRIEIAPECSGVLLPPLTLLTLVENSIKHGLEPKRGGGLINITAQPAGEHVVIEVRDTGQGFSASSSGTGLGLANIKQRFAILYGEAATLELTAPQEGGVTATMRIPTAITTKSPL